MAYALRGLRAILIASLFFLIPMSAHAQDMRQILPGILGNTVNTIIQQELQRGAGPQQGQGGGQVMFNMHCPGRWIQGGMGYQCQCPDGSLANMVGGQIVCPSAPRQPTAAELEAQRQAEEAKRAAAAQRTQERAAREKERREKAEAQKVYDESKRHCFERNDRSACEQAHSFPDAATKDRERISAHLRRMDEKQRAEIEARLRAAAEQQRIAVEQQRSAVTAERMRVADEIKQRIIATGEQIIGAAMQIQPAQPERASTAPAQQPSTETQPKSASPEIVSPTAASELSVETRGRLDREVEHLGGQNYKPTLAKAEGAIEKGASTLTRIGLIEGGTYAFVAACANCTHVQLGLMDSDGGTLGVSPEQAQTVILGGVAPKTAEHVIHLSAPGCTTPTCHAGFQVLKQHPVVAAVAGAPSTSEGSATATATPTAAEVLTKQTVKKATTAAPKAAPLKGTDVQTASLPTVPTEVKPKTEPKVRNSNSCGETTCRGARNACIRSCRERNVRSTSCSIECQQAFQLCSDSGEWSTRACRRSGLARN